jgi:hypothetical protein
MDKYTFNFKVRPLFPSNLILKKLNFLIYSITAATSTTTTTTTTTNATTTCGIIISIIYIHFSA